MILRKHHLKILKVLGHNRNGLTQNQLFKKVERPFSKPTFQRKLQDLVKGGFVQKEQRGHQSLLCKITELGERRLELDSEIEELANLCGDENIIKTLVDTSIEIAEHKPLVSKTAFLISKSSPIFTIAHFPSKSQYENLLQYVKEDESRLELAKLVNALLEFYTEPETMEGSYFARYLEFKGRCFFMGFLPPRQSSIVDDLSHLRYFGKKEGAAYKLTRGLMKTCFFPLLDIIEQKLRTDDNFRAGKAFSLFHGCVYYDPKDKAIRDIRSLDANTHQRIVKALEDTPPEEFKRRILKIVRSNGD